MGENKMDKVKISYILDDMISDIIDAKRNTILVYIKKVI